MTKRKQQMMAVVLAAGAVAILIITIWAKDTYRSDKQRVAHDLDHVKSIHSEKYTFALYGDNKDGYAQYAALAKNIDSNPNISFAIDEGDLVEKDEEGNYAYFIRETIKNIKIPVLSLLGNHDIAVGPSGKDIYKDVYGPLYYSFDIGRVHFTMLDVSSESDPDPAQKKWLEEDLAKSQGAALRLIFMHIPLYDPRGAEFHHCLNPQNAADLLRVLQNGHVSHIFASHIHSYFDGAWGGIPFTITAGGGAKLYGTDPEHFFFHYLLISIDGDAMNIQVKKIAPVSLPWLGSIGADFDIVLFDIFLKAGYAVSIFLFLAAGVWFVYILRQGKTIPAK